MSVAGRLILILSLLLLSVRPAAAHAGFQNESVLRLRPDGMELKTTASPLFAMVLLGDDALDSMEPDAFEQVKPALERDAAGIFRFQSPSGDLQPVASRVELDPIGDVIFTLGYPAPAPGNLTLTARIMEKLETGESATLTVIDERHGPSETPSAGKVLTHDDPSLSLDLGRSSATSAANERRGAGEQFAKFFPLGIEHILTGYDHLLFLFALLIGCRRVRTMLAIITAFTLAHSVTLALAAMHVVHLPSRLVECVIAASIVFVGIENFVLKGRESKVRIYVTAAFGLIHGFGFAGALQETGLGADGTSILPPLLAFNLGVETGQLAVAAVILPVLLLLRRKEAFEKFAVPALSGLVILAGSVWLVERTFGPAAEETHASGEE